VKKFISNSLLYLGSTLLNNAVPFLLLPVLTHYLSVSDYGLLGFISSILGIVSIYIGFRPDIFLIVRGNQLPKEKIAQYIYNIFILTLSSFFIVLLILLAIQPVLFPEPLQPLWVIILICFLGLMRVGKLILQTIFQIEKQALHYAILEMTYLVIHFGVALILIIPCALGWLGKYIAEVSTATIFFCITIFILYKKNYIINILQVDLLKELFNYLFPFTFHVLGLVLMNGIDRIFISNMLGVESVGLYTIAYAFGALVGIVHDALLKTWSPYFYEGIAKEEAQINLRIVKYTYLYYLGSLLLLIGAIIILPYLFEFMVDAKFYAGKEFIAMIALAYTFEGVRKLSVGYLFHQNKVRLIAGLTLLAGLINMPLNYWLIDINGLMGAAQATALSFAIVWVLTFFYAQKNHRMPWFKVLKEMVK